MSWEPHHFICSVPSCGRVMDERYETVWSSVHGWEKKRDQGGTNHIALRRPQPQYMCNPCMEKQLAGLDPGQEALWNAV